MAQRAKAWPGWITFAAVMLIMIGAFNILEGIAALLQRTVTYIAADRLVVIDLRSWGLIALVSGGLLVVVGLSLLSRNEIARAVAVVLVALHALVQLTALAAFPVWSLLMIALDVVVLFALTVHWSPVEATATAPEVDTATRPEGYGERSGPPSMPAGTSAPRPAH
jgi:hypothetical protein